MSALAIIGAGGRVGTLMRGAAALSQLPLSRFWSSRATDADAAPDGFRWSLEEGPGALVSLVERMEEPPVLFLLAGATTGSDADLATNSRLASACLEAASVTGVKRVLLASSSAVYGQPTDGLIAETDAPREPNPYGIAKLAMEVEAARYCSETLEICCLRIGNVLGADALMRSAINATANAPLLLDRFADGDGPRRSYIGPMTLLRVIESLAFAVEPLPFLLNVAAPQPVGMADLARAGDFPWRWRPAPAEARQNIVLSCARLQQLVDFSPLDTDPGALLRQLSSVLDHPNAPF